MFTKIKSSWNELKTTKMSFVKFILTLVFVLAMVVSNIISSRTFNFFGNTMTSAVFLFPITYILSDLFSEVYGYKWSRVTCYAAFIANFLTVAIFGLVSLLPTLPWIVDTAIAFKSILGGVSACTVASLIAFVVGDFMNDKVFAKMKENHADLQDHKGFMGRAILSSLVGELFDSCIYLPLAFLVFNPIMTLNEVLIMIALQVALKVGYEIVIFPLTKLITTKVANYEAAQITD